MYETCSELAIFMYLTCNSINNLVILYGLVDARISASEKDLPVSAAGSRDDLNNSLSPISSKVFDLLTSEVM